MSNIFAKLKKKLSIDYRSKGCDFRKAGLNNKSNNKDLNIFGQFIITEEPMYDIQTDIQSAIDNYAFCDCTLARNSYGIKILKNLSKNNIFNIKLIKF